MHECLGGRYKATNSVALFSDVFQRCCPAALSDSDMGSACLYLYLLHPHKDAEWHRILKQNPLRIQFDYS